MKALLLIVLALVATLSQGALSPFVGRYYTQCTPYFAGAYVQKFMYILENGYFIRHNVFTTTQCTGGFDFSYDSTGYTNEGIGNVTNTIGATNFDFAQDLKLVC